MKVRTSSSSGIFTAAGSVVGRSGTGSSSVRGLHRAGLPVGRHLASSVKERDEDGVDLVGGQQGGTVAKAG
jgi:hypothetical protein